MTLKKRRILLFVFVLIFAVAAVVINFYVAGFRLSPDFKIIKTGGIYVYSPESYSDIYLNNKLKKQTGLLQKGVFIQNLKPGKYSVLVGKKDYWPWQKKVKVEAEMVAEARAMLVPQNPQGKVILKGRFLDLYGSPEQKLLFLVEKEKKSLLKKPVFYLPEDEIFIMPGAKEAAKLLIFKNISEVELRENSFIFSTDKGLIKTDFDLNNRTYKAEKIIIETAQNKIVPMNKKTGPSIKFENFKSSQLANFKPSLAKISPSKREIIWRDEKNNTIWFDIALDAKTLPYFLLTDKNKIEFPIQIFQSRFTITNIDFFPGRRDIIVVAIENGVYALELDGRGGERMAQPIYKGKRPTFAVFPDEKKIYILDDENLLYVEL